MAACATTKVREKKYMYQRCVPGKTGGWQMAETDEPTIDQPFIMMENLSHKLRLLNYEAEFCSPKDITPFSRVYFALPSNNTA